MTPMVEGIIVFLLLAFAYRQHYIAARNKRVRDAMRGFNPVNVHGTRKFASREQMKKSGLL